MTTSRIARSDVVLLVDADADTRTMYSEFLRHHGFDVVPVATRHDALAAAPDADAIVTEILLPSEVEGLALVEALKGDHRTCDVPLVVVTSCAWETDRVLVEAAGCDLFMPKPCFPQDLMRAVRRLMTRRRLRERTRPFASRTSAP
jgi:two-component system, cell cycle response regulator DivK